MAMPVARRQLTVRGVVALAMTLPALVGGLARPARAQVITLTPAQPSIADSVKVTAGNSFANGCWFIQNNGTCQTPLVDTLKVLAEVSYCSSCSFCPANAPIYQQTCNFGLLPAGTHIALLTEVHTNPADPLPTKSVSITFEVLAPTSVSYLVQVNDRFEA